jgi:hypothetical protein
MYPHRIRLRGAWEFEPAQGRARFRRRFGYPGRIDAYERVWLTFAGVGDRAWVSLNGVALGEHAGPGVFDFEVTALLRPRNEVLVEVEGDGQGGMRGEVAMEVRATAYLRNVSVRQSGGEVQVSGEVVGEADGLLELYLIADRSPTAYQAVTATPEGQSFSLVCSAVGVDGGPVGVVKLDLVRGAVSWYTVEQALTGQSTPGRDA